MGYKFRIKYKMGASNKVADALPRPWMPSRKHCLMAVCHPIPDIMEFLRKETQSAEDLTVLRLTIVDGTADSSLSYSDGQMYIHRRVYVSSSSEVKGALLYEHHSTSSADHLGVDCTFRCLVATFYWKGMRKDVKSFVEPLPIPTQVWEDVSMNVITGLNQSHGFITNMVVGDYLSKYANFGPLPGHFMLCVSKTCSLIQWSSTTVFRRL